MMFSCCNRLELDADSVKDNTGTFADGIEISLAFSDMQAVATRAMGGSEPELTDLDIFLFVFDGNSLRQTLHIPSEQTQWAENDGYLKNNRIKFTACLPQTDNDAVIHIVALKDDAEGSFARKIDEVGYGLEDYVMPQFAVSGDQDAYWQRIELGCPIIVTVDNADDSGLEDVEGTEEQVKGKLKLVKLVRNFARIKLSVAEDVTNFKVMGWTVVNDLDGGSVTPWYSRAGSADIEYPEFIKKVGDEDTPCGYNDLVAQGYPGVSYAGANLRNTMNPGPNQLIKDGSTWGTDDKYIYDRKVSSVNPLYILIYGSLNDNPGYYKVSLGYRDIHTGLVTDYNVLRNIEYHIRITGVTAPGYKTADEAAAGPAFNNVSGDVSTRSMLQISDGVDMLYVNFVTYVVTQKDEVVKFRYRYLENIIKNGADNVQNGKVVWDATDQTVLPYNAGVGLKTVNDDPSAIVQTITGPIPVKDEISFTDWNELQLTFPDPTDEIREQKFIIYTPPVTYEDGTSSVGLSRTINLIVRNPWEYERVKIYPGLWVDDTQFPDWDADVTPDNDGEIYIGPKKGDALTIFFELPAGLPMSMFPLSFVIESDRQNIENAPQGNCSVQNGESLFKEDLGVNDLRIQYVKTVNWDEYAPNGEYSTSASRIIRARFLTTTDMSTYPAGVDNIVTTVRIHNQAFVDADYKFTRKKDQTVENPQNSINTHIFTETVVETTAEPFTVIWDFSHSSWDAAAGNVSNNNNFSETVKGKDERGEDVEISVNTVTTVTRVTKVTKTVGDNVTVEENRELISRNETNRLEYLELTIANGNTAYRMKADFEDGRRYFLTNRTSNSFTLNVFSVATPDGSLSEDGAIDAELKITAAANTASTTPAFTPGGGLSVSNTNQVFSNIQTTNLYKITASTGTGNTIKINPAGNYTGNNNGQQLKFFKFELTEKSYHKITTTIVTESNETVSSGSNGGI